MIWWAIGFFALFGLALWCWLQWVYDSIDKGTK